MRVQSLDDKDWVIKNISIKYDHIFVDWNRGANSYEDLFLMSQCKHNIISMSTFSWWSSYLCNNEDKVITLPSEWFIGEETLKSRIAKNMLVI